MKQSFGSDINTPRAVIVGCGFGGLTAARHLGNAPVHVTVVDRRNFHLFQPLLYQVATGGLSPGDIASPIRSILRKQKNTDVLLGEVTGVDLENRQVRLQESGRLSYDFLIVGTGVRHHYFGHDTWAAVAPGLKTIEDAVDIRTRILLAFEAAEREPDQERRRDWLTFVLVGGGPTGVELAGALAEIANESLAKDFRHINPREAKILLIESSERILTGYIPKLSAKAAAALAKLGVTVLANSTVINVDETGVEIRTSDGSRRLAARTVLWTAGVRASSIGRLLVNGDESKLDRFGRVIVDEHLNIPGRLEIFVIGDLAVFTHQMGQPLPGVATVAIQQGRYAADAIVARLKQQPLKAFRYRDPGQMATIGRNAAIADIRGIYLWGFPAWITWVFLHLMKLVEFENRLLVFIQWLFYYVTHNRGARLITGEHRLPCRF